MSRVTPTDRPAPDSSEVNGAVGYADLGGLISLMTGDEKQSTSANSTLDVLWVLYDRVLEIDPQDPDADDRDRFLLSKGHGPMAYYAVLAAKGFIDPELLRTTKRMASTHQAFVIGSSAGWSRGQERRTVGLRS